MESPRKPMSGIGSGGWEKSVLRTVHQNETPITVLLDDLINEFSASFLPGELVNFSVKQNGKKIKGEVTHRSAVHLGGSAFKDIENTAINNSNANSEKDRKVLFIYDVRLDKENKIICQVPAYDLQRFGNIPSRKTLRNFITDCAMYDVSPASKKGDKCWMVKDNILKTHSVFDVENSTPKTSKKPSTKKAVSVKRALPVKEESALAPKKKRAMTTLESMFSRARTSQKVALDVIDGPTKKERKMQTLAVLLTPVNSELIAKASPTKKTESSPEKTKPKVRPEAEAAKNVVAAQPLSTKRKGGATLASPKESPDAEEAATKGKKLSSKKTGPPAGKRVRPVKEKTKKEQVTRKPSSKSQLDADAPPSKRKKKATIKSPVEDGLLAGGALSPKILLVKLDDGVADVGGCGSKIRPIEIVDAPSTGAGSKPRSVPKKKKDVDVGGFVNPDANKRKKNGAGARKQNNSTSAKVISSDNKKLRQTTLFDFGKRVSVSLNRSDIAHLSPTKTTTSTSLPLFANNTTSSFLPSAIPNKILVSAAGLSQLNVTAEKQVLSPTAVSLPVFQDLPAPTAVAVPTGFPIEKFGDAVMIVDFFYAYREKLPVRAINAVNINTFMDSLVAGHSGYSHFGEFFVTLLNTLLKDSEFQDFGVPISNINVDLFNVADMLTIGTRSQNAALVPSEQVFSHSPEVLDLIASLRMKEIYELEVCNIVTLLVELIGMVLATGLVRDAIQNNQLNIVNIRKKIFSTAAEIKSLKKDASLITQAFTQLQEDAPEGGTQRQEAAWQREAMQEKEKLQQEKNGKLLQLKNTAMLEKKKLEQCNSICRRTCLGKDRNQARYWLFSTKVPGLFVETGWTNCENYSCQSDEANNEKLSEKDESSKNSVKKCGGPCQQSANWFVYENLASIEVLMSRLSPSFDSEKELKKKLFANKDYLTNLYNNCQKSFVVERGSSLSNFPTPSPTINSFQTELLALREKISEAAIACKFDVGAWEAKTVSCENCQNLGAQMVVLLDVVFPRYMRGPLAPKRVGDTNEFKDSVARQWWRTEANESVSASRLNNLLKMFANAVAWESSPAKVRCKVCGRKNAEDIVLCEVCTSGFHIHCLRPKLTKVPDNRWHCLSCERSNETEEQPKISTRSTTKSLYKEESSDESSDTSDGDRDGDDDEDYVDHFDERKTSTTLKCSACKGQSDSLIVCYTCDRGFHIKCAKLRHPPRGMWSCSRCKKK